MTELDATAPVPVSPAPTNTVLSFEVASRLSFIRYLHHLGVEQARFPEPRSSAAVLMLHDAVEAFLVLAAEHRGVTAPTQFLQYWDALARPAGTGVQLAVKHGMNQLNRARVALKHHGVPPSRETIAKSVSDTTTFFAANTPLVFGISYEQISMADVISQEPVRDRVRRAETAAAEGNYAMAMVELADAEARLMSPKRPVDERSPLLFGETIDNPWGRPAPAQIRKALSPWPDRRHGSDMYSEERRDLAERIAALIQVTGKLQAATRITALGVDYAAYLRFHSLVPGIDDMMEGKREFFAPTGYAPTREDYEFCLQFMITLALRLAAAESQLAPPSWFADQTPGRRREWQTIATGTWLEEDTP